MKAIEFVAYLPPIQSAITFSGNGEGARIKLDVPEKYRGDIVALSALSETALRVRITVESRST